MVFKRVVALACSSFLSREDGMFQDGHEFRRAL